MLEALPDYEIHIAAYVFVSERLKSLASYPNCYIHQIVLQSVVDELKQDMDAYLDINYGGEVAQIVHESLQLNKPVFAFRETTHQQNDKMYCFTSDSVNDMVTKIREVVEK